MSILEKYKVNSKNNSEFYKVYDDKGKFLREIDVHDEKNLTNEFLYGVTCFVINENNEVLMEVRANTELTPGKIDLVSGHVNGNESGTKAIIRELNEEVGILNVGPNKLHKVSGLAKPLGFESRGKIRNFFIDFYCLITKADNVTSIKKEEVKSLKWIPMEHAFEMIKSGKTKFPKQEANVSYEEVFKNVRGVCLNKNLQEKKVVEK